MQITLVNDYITEWVKRRIAVGIERELKVPKRMDKIISIIGPRRSGKTYFFYQLISEDRENSLYLNFEDTRLADINFKEIREVVRAYIEVCGREPSSIFFDEIQNVVGWEKALRSLLDLQKYNLFVTGSSSKLLSREIATQLRGRAFSYLLLPFSFREFLKAKKFDFKAPLTFDEIARAKNLLREYLEYGGFPEVVLEDVEKDRILKEYSEMILFKDIVERHRLRNISLARLLLNFFLQNFSNEFSVNRVLKSSATINFGKNTLYNYIEKVQDSVAIFFLNRFSPKVYQRMSWPKKVYVCDTGLAKVTRISENIGKLMENVVYLELLRLTNRRPMLEIYYWKESQQREVDFLLKEGVNIEHLIQVTYASGRDEVEKREIKSLIEASRRTGCKNLSIITWDYEDKIKVEGESINFTPLWKWLLTT
ncbi:MAG: ATP-binding protein [Nitrososphaeria archaeon]|nr:ATP-binding protein [Nitrososphaeria archaeon]